MIGDGSIEVRRAGGRGLTSDLALRMIREWPVLLIVTVLLAATAHQAACALQVIEPSEVPGRSAPGNELAVVAGLLSLAAAAVLAFVYALGQRADTLAGALAPVGAAFVMARFYTFDAYYAPGLRRISDGDMVSMTWMLGLIAASLLAAVCVWRWPAAGLMFSGLVLVLCGFTVFGQAAGH